MAYVNTVAYLIVMLKQSAKLAFAVLEMLFGMIASWFTMSADLTGSRPVNMLILAIAAAVIAQGMEDVFEELTTRAESNTIG